MEKYKRLGKNTLIFAIGNFSSKFMSYIMIPLYTYILSTEDYGVIDILNTTVTLLIPILSLAISEGVMRFALDQKYDNKDVFSIGVYVSLLSIVLSSLTYIVFNNLSTYRPYFAFFLLMYGTSTLSQTIGQFVKGIEKVSVYTFAGIVQTFSFLFFNIILLVFYNFGIKGYLIASIISNVMSIAILSIGGGCFSFIKVPSRISKDAVKEMLRYSIPLIPNNISWWISNSSDKYILAFFYTTSVVGLYSTAYKIPSILQMIITVFWGAWQISAVEDFGSESSRSFFSSIYKKLSSLLCVVCASIDIFTELIAKIAFQKDFFVAWRFAPILLIGFLFSGLSSFLGTIYTSSMKTKMVFASTFAGAILNIVLNFILIPKYSGYGAAFATALSYFSIWVFRLFDSRKIMPIEIELKKDVISYLTLLIMSVILITVDSVYDRYCLAILFYLFVMFNERTLIISIISKFKKAIKP